MIAATLWPRTILGAVLMSSTALTVLSARSSAQSAAGSGLTATVDAGASRIHYDGYLPSGLVDLAPSIRFDGANSVVVARGSLARFESGNVNYQGALVGSAFTPPGGMLRGEIAASASLGYHQSIGSTGIAQALGRLHLAGPSAGAWAGGGWGWSALGGGIGAGVATREVGGWLRRPTPFQGSLRVTTLLRATHVSDVRYSELSGALRWTTARVEIGADGGARQGDQAIGSGRERAWLAADAAVWVGPNVAVVGSAGRFLSDPTTSAIGGRYASLGLRLALRRPSPDELPRVILPRTMVAPPVPPAGGTSGAGTEAGAGAEVAEGLVVEQTGDGRVTLRFTLPASRSAELMGDFTDWSPLSLQRDPDGRWAVTVALTPGVHRVNLRSDEGPWRAPPGLTAVDDGFGGLVGLLVVSR